jgi:hypothetical protein
MRWSRFVSAAAGGGIAITLLTGLYPIETRLGATMYGLPVAWLVRRVTAPEYGPWYIDWLGLIVDVLVWTGVVLSTLVLYDVGRRRLEDAT